MKEATKESASVQWMVSKNILDLIEKYQVVIQQVNGQRRLDGPPANWTGTVATASAEVFVGKLPRDIFEDTVYPFFAQAGRIYELRLMMDFSGNNRGYCFVTYLTRKEAINAIKTLHDREIIPGRRVAVIMSTNNCKLWLGSLPSEIKSSEVILKICSKTADVKEVIVCRNENNEAEYVHVTYTSHRGAAMARRTLMPEKNSLFSSSVAIEWANPQVIPTTMIEESGLAVKVADTENLYFLRSIEKKVITIVENPETLKSEISVEKFHENIDCYIQDNLIISSRDLDPAILTVARNSNMSTSKQKKPQQKQPNKAIVAPEAPSLATKNSPFLLPRPIELSKKRPSESFSLFDDFTFSHTPTTVQEDQRWTGSFNQFQNLNPNNYASNFWIESIIPRFSNLSVQPDEARPVTGNAYKNGNSKDVGMFSSVLQEKVLPAQRPKIFGPLNAPNHFQPVIWPEKGFPFHPPGLSSVASGAQYSYNQIPGMPLPYAVCTIPCTDPWAQSLFDNRAYFDFNQHHCSPNIATCMEAYTHSHRIQSEQCNLPCCNQHLRVKEVQVEEDTNYNQQQQQQQQNQQQPESSFQPQPLYRGRRKPKSIPKVTPRRKRPSESHEIAEQHTFVSKPPENIPKGARPILSAKK